MGLIKNIYDRFFLENDCYLEYLDLLSKLVEEEYPVKEIEYLQYCYDLDIDFIALEYHLRKIDSNNILSFIFIRLSALAESFPENQNKFINQDKLNLFNAILLLSKSVVQTAMLELKVITLHKVIKEFRNV